MAQPTLAPRCSIACTEGLPCGRESMEGAPFPICLPHLHAAYRHAVRLDMRPWVEVVDVGPDPEPDDSVVYYVRVGDQIKIGTTRMSLTQRFQMLPPDHQTLVTEPGGRDLERQRHRQFDRLRIARNREWFRAAPELWDHIRDLRRRAGMDPS